jgi:hypothetical protein
LRNKYSSPSPVQTDYVLDLALHLTSEIKQYAEKALPGKGVIIKNTP